MRRKLRFDNGAGRGRRVRTCDRIGPERPHALNLTVTAQTSQRDQRWESKPSGVKLLRNSAPAELAFFLLTKTGKPL